MLYAGSAAHNRAVAASAPTIPGSSRSAFIPLNYTERAVALLQEAIELDCTAIHVPSTAAGDRSPTHPDLDPFWSLLNDSGRPFVLHEGGGGRLLDRAFHDNGRPVTDHLGGGENIRSKDFLAIAHSPSLFLGAMILDGLFDRFPKLRGGVIEEGAGGSRPGTPARLRPAGVPPDREAAHRAGAQAVGVPPRTPLVHAVPG